MNCYSFLGHDYSLFNVIVSHLIALKILKSQNSLKTHQESASDPKLQKTIALQSLFSLIRLNLLSKNGHRLKCLGKSLMLYCFI